MPATSMRMALAWTMEGAFRVTRVLMEQSLNLMQVFLCYRLHKKSLGQAEICTYFSVNAWHIIVSFFRIIKLLFLYHLCSEAAASNDNYSITIISACSGKNKTGDLSFFTSFSCVFLHKISQLNYLLPFN